MNWLAVFIGGGLGSVLRFGISKLTIKWSDGFPYGTLISNVCATLLLGLITYGFFRSLKMDSFWYLFLAIGFCGGLSTFSTFSLETMSLLKMGNSGIAILNVLLNVIICLGVLWLIQSKLTAES